MQWIEIRFKGHIDPQWSKYLAGLSVSHISHGETLLTGPVRDQAAVYGLIERLSGLGLQLISVAVSQPASSPGKEGSDM